MNEFKPSKSRYFLEHSKIYALGYIIIASIFYLFGSYKIALALVGVLTLEIVVLRYEASWAADNKAITISNDRIIGPTHPKVRWKFMKWKRIEISTNRIDRERTHLLVNKKNFLQKHFSRERSIYSLDGNRIFVDISFTDHQIKEINSQISAI